MTAEHRAALWLAMHEYIGALRASGLRNLAGSFSDIPKLSAEEIRSAGILQERELKLWTDTRVTEEMLERTEARMERAGIRMIIRSDGEFPERLKNLRDCPEWLFVRGHLPPEDLPRAAIVGARGCTDYGKTQAELFGRLLARQGIPVVSGLAAGIDSAAHEGVLCENGSAYAVLGNGLNLCYPKSSRNLYQRIPGRGGLISEYLPDVPPMHWHFPARNRIISGLADLVIVIEARKRSGSLITADLALEQGRDVFALPGRWDDPLSEGCNRLIRVGAGIITNPSDILDYFHRETQIPPEKERCVFKLAKNEKMVYSAIDSRPRSAEEIIVRSGLSAADCMSILMDLEMRGLVQQPDNQYYVRIE